VHIATVVVKWRRGIVVDLRQPALWVEGLRVVEVEGRVVGCELVHADAGLEASALRSICICVSLTLAGIEWPARGVGAPSFVIRSRASGMEGKMRIASFKQASIYGKRAFTSLNLMSPACLKVVRTSSVALLYAFGFCRR
jgi:hypothetical protein